jgi:hypothetical protein
VTTLKERTTQMATRVEQYVEPRSSTEDTLLRERTAIINTPMYGVDEDGYVTLRFEAYVDEHTCAHQRLNPEEALELLKAARVNDVADLHGYPIVVLCQRDRIEYMAPWQANGLWDRRTVRR